MTLPIESIVSSSSIGILFHMAQTTWHHSPSFDFLKAPLLTGQSAHFVASTAVKSPPCHLGLRI